MFSKDSSENWFSKPAGLFAKQDWALSTANSSKIENTRPVAADELVDAAGSCPVVQQVAEASTDASGATVAGPVAAPSGGVALSMTECEVVRRAGAPERVEISANPGGERTAVLTVLRGNPGIYRFTAGRLTEIERVAEPEPPKRAAPQRKRPATASR